MPECGSLDEDDVGVALGVVGSGGVRQIGEPSLGPVNEVDGSASTRQGPSDLNLAAVRDVLSRYLVDRNNKVAGGGGGDPGHEDDLVGLRGLSGLGGGASGVKSFPRRLPMA